MRGIVANVQTGFEGLRWLRNEAELEGRFSDYLKNGHASETALVAIRGMARQFPSIDIKTIVPRLLEDRYEYLGMGAEAVVVRDGDVVRKYLTGKTQKPEILAERLERLHQITGSHLGDFLVPTGVDVVEEQLFKGLHASRYVRLTQPFVETEYVDPHLDAELLEAKPEIAQAMGEFTSRLTELFVDEGLLMDTVNRRNIVWGSYDGSSNRLHELDTLPLDYSSRDFIGIHVPFWRPDINVESLAELANEFTPSWLDDKTDELIW